MLPRFEYLRPPTIDEAVRALSRDGARIHAGGTDLLGCLREQILPTRRLVSLTRMDALRGVRVEAGELHIGALTTLSALVRDPWINKQLPGLAEAARAAASPQLRNQGTIGGNLCQKPRCWYYRGEFDCLRKGGETCLAVGGENHYHCILGGDRCFIVHPSDPAPMLVALGARVRIAGSGGARELPVERLHVPPSEDPGREVALAADEIITEVVVPAPAPDTITRYRKVRARQSWDFALSSVALALELGPGARVRAGRVVLGGVAPIPWRSRAVEGAIVGQTLAGPVIERAARAAVKDAEALTHNAYKIPLTRALVAEQLERLMGARRT